MTGHQSRAERAAYPLARDAIRKLAEASGGCLRPLQLRRTDTVTGETVSMMVPCWATLASISRPARSEPGRCERRSAGKAGIWRTSRT